VALEVGNGQVVVDDLRDDEPVLSQGEGPVGLVEEPVLVFTDLGLAEGVDQSSRYFCGFLPVFPSGNSLGHGILPD